MYQASELAKGVHDGDRTIIEAEIAHLRNTKWIEAEILRLKVILS